MKFMGLALMALALGAAGPAWAQGESVFLAEAPANHISSSLPGLTVRHLSHRASGPDCPKNVLKLDFFYPQGFGRPKIDALVAEAIKAEFEELRAPDDTSFCGRESCDLGSCGLWPVEKTFAVHTPSPGFVSILFTEESYTGGAHGNRNYNVLNFNLENDRPMALTDLFPKPEKSVPAYWGQVYAEWCRLRGVNFPPHWGAIGQECRPGENPKPPEEFREADDLEDLGRLIFTPQGATLLLEPYESGSYASGSQALDLPKDMLLKIGANPALWTD